MTSDAVSPHFTSLILLILLLKGLKSLNLSPKFGLVLINCQMIYVLVNGFSNFRTMRLLLLRVFGALTVNNSYQDILLAAHKLGVLVDAALM